ncbi:sulfatase [Algoriphagus sp.]|uniref:sulfatase family protein n=1 Tax=Algoriphagus sp. TaxID=1872435 RepID=UPI00261FE458|nr:sulfatase [Algoriphagus sp.]
MANNPFLPLKNSVFALALLVILLSCTKKKESSAEKTASPPNIILVFADDLGYGDLGAYGAKEWKTPHLDQLAEDGVKFTQFYVPHAVCTASRAALLTGTYANRLELFGALDHTANHGLNPKETTIAELLKTKGYATGMVGKWHLGHLKEFLPTRQGFDSYFGLPYSNDMWPHHPEAKEYYPPLPLMENEETIEILDQQHQLTTQYTERALDFIDQNKETPFFLYLAHSMPHVPLYVSEKFKGKSQQGLYGDVMMEIDWSMGEIRKKLKALELEENTLIIFTSDNGPWLSYGGHAGQTAGLKEGKGTSWEGGIRVPAIMTWPGVIPAGSIQEQAAMTIDILPTLAHITQAALPDLPIDGRNIWPLTQGETLAHQPYYAYYNQNELQAVIFGKWKLVFPHRYRTLPEHTPLRNDGIPVKYDHINLTEPMLFNLVTDPFEKTNVADIHPDMYDKLTGFAELARQDMGDALTNRSGTGNRKAGKIEDR